MWTKTAVTELLGIRYPLLQAGMIGAARADLAAAVSMAGGLGTLGAAGMNADELHREMKAIRLKTNCPYSVNLHIPMKEVLPDEGRLEEVCELLQPYWEELGLQPLNALASVRREAAYKQALFEEQLAVILEESVPIVSFSYGVLDNDWIDRLKHRGIKLIGTATTVSEGAHLEHQGVDLVVGQGSEAGGERATFLGAAEQAAVGTIALTPLLADALHVPVIAAGGVMDGRGIAAALALGAAGVQLGTAFLTCPESDASRRTKEALLTSMEESTVLTRSYTGRYARTIRNKFIADLSDEDHRLLPYPYQEALTRPIREAAEEQERVSCMAVWSGQASRLLTRELPAGDLVRRLVKETDVALDRLRRL
ncbi:NAD(P)H-dependent flavin oxidoreductase [Gorillibacterium timonense]|uniref:NAD(P)H-dependent flavin oxidoreductase n=1 Tax=Gorillibacterium timonense TaxID=1689269 RepID=UPI00071DECE6|nr:nitronate monooxygenase [Gorillibacterium timonense]